MASDGGQGLRWGTGKYISFAMGTRMAGGQRERTEQGFSLLREL